jgi:hypothetical protein
LIGALGYRYPKQFEVKFCQIRYHQITHLIIIHSPLLHGCHSKNTAGVGDTITVEQQLNNSHLVSQQKSNQITVIDLCSASMTIEVEACPIFERAVFKCVERFLGGGMGSKP